MDTAKKSYASAVIVLSLTLIVSGCNQLGSFDGSASGDRATQSHGGSGQWQVTSSRSEVGVVWLEAGGTCTETLMRQDVVLTAAHCVNRIKYAPAFGMADVPELRGRFERFNPNGMGGAWTRYSVDLVSAIVAPGAFTAAAGANDWAVILLAEPISKTVALPARISSYGPHVGGSITFFGAGYHPTTPGGSWDGLMRRRTFRWGTHPEASGGDSGGPLFAADGRIVAVYSTSGLAWGTSTHLWKADRRAAINSAVTGLYENRTRACTSCLSGGGGMGCARRCAPGICRSCVEGGGGTGCLDRCVP